MARNLSIIQLAHDWNHVSLHTVSPSCIHVHVFKYSYTYMTLLWPALNIAICNPIIMLNSSIYSKKFCKVFFYIPWHFSSLTTWERERQRVAQGGSSPRVGKKRTKVLLKTLSEGSEHESEITEVCQHHTFPQDGQDKGKEEQEGEELRRRSTRKKY